MRGRIDNTEVYLDEDQLPAFSGSVDGLEDPSKIKGTVSTTMRVVRTSESARAFGTEHFAQVATTRKPVLHIGEDSVALFSSEVLVIKRNRDEYECINIGGNALWFDWAKRTKLREIVWPNGPSVTASNAIFSWAGQSLAYWPLVDYGDFEGESDSYNVGIMDMRPGARLSEVLRIAFFQQGWDVVPKGLRARRDWTKYIHLPSGDEIRTKTEAVTLTMYDPPVLQYQYEHNGEVPMPWPFDAGAGDGWVGWPTYKWTAPEDCRVWLKFDLKLPFTSDPGFTGKRFRVTLWDETDNVGIASWDSDQIPAGPGTMFVSAELDPVFVTSGHVLYMAVTIDGVVESVELDNYSNAWFNADVTYTLNDALLVDTLVPDCTVVELMKRIATAQGFLFKTNGTTVEVWAREDFYRMPIDGTPSRDWTERHDTTEAPEQFIPEYPTRLNLRWEDDDGDGQLRRLRIITLGNYGNASIPIERGVKDEQTLLMPWASTAMGARFVNCMIPVISSDAEEVDYKHKERLLIADGVAVGSWTFGGAVRSTYPRCYFVPYEKGRITLAFDNPTLYGGTTGKAIDRQWKHRLDEMRRARMFKSRVFMRDHEVRDFDHGMPTLARDENAQRWFHVREYRQHFFGVGDPTTAIMVEIPGIEVRLNTPINGVPVYPPVEPQPPYSGYFSWNNDHGLLYTRGGETFVLVLNVLSFSPGLTGIGTWSWSDTNDLVLTNDFSYRMVLNPSPVGPGSLNYGTFSWSDTDGLLLTKNGITYQVDMIQL